MGHLLSGCNTVYTGSAFDKVYQTFNTGRVIRAGGLKPGHDSSHDDIISYCEGDKDYNTDNKFFLLFQIYNRWTGGVLHILHDILKFITRACTSPADKRKILKK